MGDTIIYLEKFVESTAYLPPELQRILNTIKDLDERSEDLAAQIQENVEEVLKINPNGNNRKSLPDEVADLRGRIDADQRLLIQFSEEKVQLAIQGYDLLEAHHNQLNMDISDFTQELQAKGFDPLGDSLMGVEESVGVKPTRDTTRFDSFDSMDPSSLDAKPPRKMFQQEKAQTPLPMMPQQPLGLQSADGYTSGRRRAAQAAVHAAAAAVAAMDQDGDIDDDSAAALAAAGAGAAGTAAPAGRQAAPATVPAGLPSMAPMAPLSPLEPQPISNFTQPLGHGLKHAAENPQVAGRLLTHHDISPGLVGKRGELFWPDDNLWYLVEIHSVDLENRKAQIFYMTGEAEELDLDEIVKEGHLTLHPS